LFPFVARDREREKQTLFITELRGTEERKKDIDLPFSDFD
jgi:hypothetical protein